MSPEVESHVHEPPSTMMVPLVVLAGLSLVGGLVGQPMQAGGHAFARWLRPVFEGAGSAHALPAHELSASVEWLLIALSVAAAVLGLTFAFRVYLREPSLSTRLSERWGALQRVLLHKYWVDEVYDALVVAPIYGLSRRLWSFWDEKVVDGIVNGVGYTFEGFSAALRLFQTGFVGTYALFFALGVLALVLHLMRH